MTETLCLHLCTLNCKSEGHHRSYSAENTSMMLLSMWQNQVSHLIYIRHIVSYTFDYLTWLCCTRTTTTQKIYKKGFIEVNGREKSNNLADDSGFNMD